MAIADTNDAFVDSDVFLRAGSFIAGPVGPTNPELYGGGSPCECKTTTDAGQPVNTAIGNFYHTFTDFDIPVRGDPILFAHTYNSQAANVLTPLGYGWTHSLNMYIDSDSENYYVHEGNGSILPFPKSGPPYPRVQATLTRDPSTEQSTFTRTHGRQSYRFLSGGRLLSITDRNDYAHTLILDATGFIPAGIWDATERTILTVIYNWQTPNMISRVSDLTGRTVYFDYDANHDLRAVTDVGGQITRFTYDAQHRLLTMTDPNGGVITNTYDLQNRVLTQTDSMSRTLQFGYTTLDSTHTQTVLTDSLGYTTVYTYDQNRLTELTRNPGTPQAATWQYGYDPNFPTAVSSITDPLMHTWRYTSDSNGNQLSATDPLSRTTRYAYNATNDLLVITNTRGLTTTFSYDAFGNPLTVTRPVTETNDLAVARLGYDPAYPGEVLTITNPLNNSWRLVHDPATGYVLTSTNPLSQSTRYTYDTVGRVVGMVSPRGYPSAAAYDAYDAPVRITDTLGFTTTFAYDANHNPTTITDTKGFTTTSHYNADDELIRVTRADGTHSDYGYDAGGRIISQTNALTQTTRYGYDAFNRLVSVTDPLTRTTAYGYDLAGNLTVMTDALGLTTTLGYDAANQLTGIKHQDPLSTPNVAFAYNLLGQRTVMTDGTGTSLYSYDSLDRLVVAQNGAQRTVGYHYDLAGQLTQLDYPGVTSGTGQVQRRYDAAGRLHEVEDWLVVHHYEFEG